MEDNYGFKPEFLMPSAPPNTSNLLYPNVNNVNIPMPNYSPSSSSNSNFLSNSEFPYQSVTSHNQAYRWIDASSSYGTVPPTAVQGGMDIDGHPIFVGRAYFEGDLIPAKVIPSKNTAYVAHGGEEHKVENFQVLCKQHFEWMSCQGGQIPPGAIEGGHQVDGETLFIGRVYHEGSQTVGKVHPSHGVCYIPFDGKEIPYTNYEVLVLRL